MIWVPLLLLTFAADIPDFRRDVQPIFEKYCQTCHADGARMGAFEYGDYANFIRENHPLVVPGKPNDSRLYLMLTGKAEPAMPLDNHSLSKSELGIIRHWITAGAKPPHLYIKPRPQQQDSWKHIYSMALSPDGNSFALGHDSYIDLIVPGTQLSAILAGRTDVEITSLDFSKQGRYLASAGGEIRVWDVAQHRPILTRNGDYKTVAISPDGRMVAAGTDLIDVATNKALRSIDGPVESLHFTPDGLKLIAVSCGKGIKIWDPATGRLVNTINKTGITAVALSPDGKLIAAAAANEIHIFPVGESLQLAQAIPFRQVPLRLAWSPDSARLAVASADRTVKVLRAADWSEILTWDDQADEIFGLQFTYDGRALAIARHDGTFERRPLAAERRPLKPVPTVYSKTSRDRKPAATPQAFE